MNAPDSTMLWLEDASELECSAFAFEQSEARFRALFDAATIGVALAGLDGTVILGNRALAAMTGCDAQALKGMSLLALAHGADRVQLGDWLRDLATGQVPDGALERSFTRGAEVFWARVTGSVVRDNHGAVHSLVVVLEDVTERKRLEMELRLAHKLEAIGKLAAGMAHEINTPLQYMSSDLGFVVEAWDKLVALEQRYAAASAMLPRLTQEGLRQARADADLDYLHTEMPAALANVRKGIAAVSRIVCAMKVFAQADGTGRRAIDLNEMIESTVTVAEGEWRAYAKTELELGDLPPVECRAGDVTQVVLHLVRNAALAVRDARAGGRASGSIKVRTTVDGGDVVLTVSDDGVGIPEAHRHLVYDPFFTTRRVGDGSGQGLTMARAVVVDQHGGRLDFVTEVGQGTTFTLRLPLRPIRT